MTNDGEHRAARGRVAAVAVLALAASLGGCDQHVAGGTSVTTVASAYAATIDVRVVKGFGPVLVTSSGRSLYLLTSDPPGGSGCFGSCTAVWPPLIAQGRTVKAGPGVDPRRLSVFQDHAGQDQVAYAGHALYTFEEDTGPGMAAGEGISTYGGVWWLVSPRGRAVTRANLSATANLGPREHHGGGPGPAGRAGRP